MEQHKSTLEKLVESFQRIEQGNIYTPEILDNISILMKPNTFSELYELLDSETISTLYSAICLHYPNQQAKYELYKSQINTLENTFSFDIDFI